MLENREIVVRLRAESRDICLHSVQNCSGPKLGRFPAAINLHLVPRLRTDGCITPFPRMPNISFTCAVVGTFLKKEYTPWFVFLQILVDCIETNVFSMDLGMEICNVERDGQNVPTTHYYFFVSKKLTNGRKCGIWLQLRLTH